MPTPMIPDSPEFELPTEMPRSTEPPELWLVRLFGALVLHALLFFGVRMAWAEIAVSQESGDEGAIEFIEIGEADDRSAKPKAEGVAPLTALKPGAVAKAAIAPDETAVIPSAKPEPSPSPSPEPNPTNTPIPTNTPSPTNSPIPQEPEPQPQKPASSQPKPAVPPSTQPKPIVKPKVTQPPKKSNSPASTKPQQPATSGQTLPEKPKPKNSTITGGPSSTGGGEEKPPVQSNFVVTPIVLQSQQTAASAGSVKGSGGGVAKLSTIPPPGLNFEFPPEIKVAAGSRFDVNVRIAVSASMQQIIDLDGNGDREITVLSDSPALKQIPKIQLEKLVEKVLERYQFEVQYEGVDTTPADVTEWEIQLAIGVD